MTGTTMRTAHVKAVIAGLAVLLAAAALAVLSTAQVPGRPAAPDPGARTSLEPSPLGR